MLGGVDTQRTPFPPCPKPRSPPDDALWGDHRCLILSQYVASHPRLDSTQLTAAGAAFLAPLQDYSERNDVEWMKHTLGWYDEKTNTCKLGYRPVHDQPLDAEMEHIPPKARVY